MTPGARIRAAIELLDKIEAAAFPADGVIASYFGKRRYAGAKDRRAVRETVFAVLRARARLDRRIGPDACPRTRLIAHLAISEGMGAKEIEALFSGEGHHSALLSAAEESLARLAPPLETPEMPASTALEYPLWLDRALRRSFGEALAGEMAALNLPAPLDVRVNILKCSRDEAARMLCADDIVSRPTPLSPLGLRLESRVRLESAAAFRNGLIEVQDEGSQLVALLVGAKPGMAVADICAGAGGKTLALAAAMKGEGELVAGDVSTRRMAAMGKRLSRAGVQNVTQTATVTGDEYRGRFDRVLVDAPCSGVGVWRRDVTARWRLTAAEMQEIINRQRAVLTAAALLPKAGGRMIYATCSLLTDENEDQVRWFLENHPGYSVIPVIGIWSDIIGGECPVKGPYLRLSPAATGTDGFFAAVLERN
ncbi:MAG: hypothetical protein A3G18_09150 [Rhodospirillales bacterium RIFCSPLOWO2_12_FULL_58_28]|nr:MAG: hypothetical protein A3G18_09150 [Rhodospirillales bacterium RIFCSPLOWO2_12_FULL_58_28]